MLIKQLLKIMFLAVIGSASAVAQWDRDSVIVDQRLSNGTSIDSIDIWSYAVFFRAKVPYVEHYPYPFTRDWIVRGKQRIISAEKYNRWIYGTESLIDVRNHHMFSIVQSKWPANITSQFEPITQAVTIRTDLIDGPGTRGGYIQFRDPWYVDYQDPTVGNHWRNRGMDTAEFRSRDVESSDFVPDTNTVYPEGPSPYRGVFLDVTGPTEWDLPHYSVAVPSEQTLGSIPGSFQYWSGDANKITFRTCDSLATGVKFMSAGACATAYYKGYLRSSEARSSGFNSQRSITYANGKYHVVYASGGGIWYLTSSDNGANWTHELLLSDRSGLNRQPSIAVMQSRQPGQCYLSVVWERFDGDYSDIIVRYLQSDGSWTSATVLWEGPMDQDCEGATPSMAMENDFQVAVWRVKTSSEFYQSGLYLWLSTDGNQYIVDGTGGASIHPSIAVPAFLGLESRFAVAWSDNGQIYYKAFRWYHEELTYTATESPSSGSGLSQHDYPSLVYISSSGRRPALAWQAYSTPMETNVVLARERGPSSWGTIKQYCKDEPYLNPSLTRHEYPDTTLVMTWHDQTNMYLAKRTTSWGSKTNLSSGRYPGLGFDPDGDNTHFRIVYTTGASAPYQIATTSQGLPKAGGGDLEMRRVVALSHGAAYAVVLEKAAILTSQGVTGLQLRAVEEPGKAFMPEESSGMVSTTNFTVPRGAMLTIETSSNASNEMASASHSGELSVVAQIIDASTGDVVISVPMDTVSERKLASRHNIYSVDLTTLAGKEVRLALVPAFKGKADLWTLTEISHDSTGATPQGGISKHMNEEPKPQVFAMAECYPNPFNPTTTIGYQLPTDGFVGLVVYDLLGTQITELASGFHVAGRYSATWNASSVASGMYFARLTVTDELGQMKFNRINKLVLAK